jgi:NAD(P)-dependent dehydrogenase (short-subunit alcohol dehydrogenase family)
MTKDLTLALQNSRLLFDQAQIDAAVKTIGETGGLDGLVNNAGVGRGGPLEHLAIDEWRYQLEVNVIGQVAMTKAALPLIRRYRGRIVFIGSIGGRVGTMLMGPYNASKFAIEGIGDALRQEMQPFGISVSIIEPGSIKTDIWEKAQDTMARLERELPAEALEQYAWHLEAFKRGLEKQAKQGVGPEKTSAAIEHALFAKRPKTRYLVGVDAKAMATMGVALPDRARDAVVKKLGY